MNRLTAEIRLARPGDARAAWEMRNAAIRSQCCDHYPPELLELWTVGDIPELFIQSAEEQFYVGTVEDAVVATGIILPEAARLDAVFVRPDMMRRGLGRQMVSFLESVGAAAGLSMLSLDATLNAAEFYRQCGFAGQTQALYQSPRGIVLDCIPMKKTLSSAFEP